MWWFGPGEGGLQLDEKSGNELHESAVWFAKKAKPEDCYRAFEAYGHAMTAASAFEMLMALMVMKAFALRLDKRANAKIQPADHPRLIQSLLKNSYDKLQRRLCESYAVSPEIKVGLADGKSMRDYLAHNFWQAHVPNLFSSDGVDIIATVCGSHANHFRLLGQALVEETGVDADDYIAMLLDAPDRLEIMEGWKALLEEQGLT